MSENDETQDQTPAEVTLQDLWRHISGMESRLRGEIHDVRTEVNARLDDQDSQLEAIRRSVDNDMARHPDLVRVENKVADVAVDVRDLKGRVNDVKGQLAKVQSRLDRGGIPA